MYRSCISVPENKTKKHRIQESEKRGFGEDVMSRHGRLGGKELYFGLAILPNVKVENNKTGNKRCSKQYTKQGDIGEPERLRMEAKCR